MLTRAGTIALRALVELARSQGSVLSGPELAKRQELPEARLEQILLQLRQAQLIEARRGRTGGYRLSRAAEDLSVQEVLDAVGGRRQLSLELEPAEGSIGQAGQRLEQQLQQRLQRAVERELSELSVAELLYDQRSWEASLDPDQGLMLG